MIIGLIGCLMLFILGVYRLIVEYPYSNGLFIPLIFTVGGFVGFIGGIMEVKKYITMCVSRNRPSQIDGLFL
ncbi:hypothetical protein [Parageobacillus toebii]|uniref:hypothetical protein n=1 Tax=Parageobacillus toebii TaxID=153151 RepID=UPI0028154236|nr:hypothetical protein [Parageobacillus toebii]WMT18436.1 hypothetical protein RFB12_14240 [Parageobacillus toebii]